MAWLEAFFLGRILLFTLVLARVSGLVTTAPFFTGDQIPMQVRIVVGVALSLLLTPTQWNTPLENPGNLADLAILMAAELLIGMVLGLGIMILISGMQLAGQMIAQMSGMSLADVLSPGTDTEVPLFANLLYMLALAVFVLIGGHRAMIDALLQTYATLPVGHAGAVGYGSIGNLMAVLMTDSFSLGVRAAAPAMVALLLATLVLGLIGRTLPQLNILVLGFGINAMVTLGVLLISIGAIACLFQEYFDPALKTLLDGLVMRAGP